MKAIAGEVVQQSGALTARESQQLTACEADVEKGGSLIVTAMEKIRDQKLYRATHETFADYCRERWQRTARDVNRLIQTEAVVQQIGKALSEDGEDLGPIGPISKGAARELLDLPPKQAAEVIKRVVDTGKKPTAENVKAAKGAAVSEFFDAKQPGKKITGGVTFNVGELTDPPDNACIEEMLTAKRVVSRKLVEAEKARGECEHSQAIAKALESIQKHGEAWKSCK